MEHNSRDFGGKTTMWDRWLAPPHELDFAAHGDEKNGEGTTSYSLTQVHFLYVQVHALSSYPCPTASVNEHHFRQSPYPSVFGGRLKLGLQVGTHFHFTQLRSRLIDYNLALRSGVAKGRASYQMALTMATETLHPALIHEHSFRATPIKPL